MILKDKTVIVVGVGPGLGGESAKLALRDGANVVIGARNEKKLEQLATKLDPTGERIATIAVDVGDEAACCSAVDLAKQKFGRVDALVQVAAHDSTFGGLMDTSADDWRAIMEINVIGAAQMSKAAAAVMKESGGGSIVLIGSQSSFLPLVDQMAYAASKGALHTAMYYMAKELGPDKIRVNMVVPTWMWGPNVEAYVNYLAEQRGVSSDVVLKEITSGMALDEMPADEDVAESVVFLCSDRARMITGQYLMVNAGEKMN